MVAMMDLLIKDLDKEMQTAEADEKDGQADYETMMADSATKRATDSKSVAEKESAKADTEAALQAHREEKDSTSKELMGTLETFKALHSDCNWLMTPSRSATSTWARSTEPYPCFASGKPG